MRFDAIKAYFIIQLPHSAPCSWCEAPDGSHSMMKRWADSSRGLDLADHFQAEQCLWDGSGPLWATVALLVWRFTIMTVWSNEHSMKWNCIPGLIIQSVPLLSSTPTILCIIVCRVFPQMGQRESNLGSALYLDGRPDGGCSYCGRQYCVQHCYLHSTPVPLSYGATAGVSVLLLTSRCHLTSVLSHCHVFPPQIYCQAQAHSEMAILPYAFVSSCLDYWDSFFTLLLRGC